MPCIDIDRDYMQVDLCYIQHLGTAVALHDLTNEWSLDGSLEADLGIVQPRIFYRKCAWKGRIQSKLVLSR